MDKDIKKDLKKLARDAETKLAESILRWKHGKEGKKLPKKRVLERQSRDITDQANEILARKGKAVWSEIKKAYRKNQGQEESED